MLDLVGNPGDRFPRNAAQETLMQWKSVQWFGPGKTQASLHSLETD